MSCISHTRSRAQCLRALPGKLTSDQPVSCDPPCWPYTLLNPYRRVQRKEHRMISYRALPLGGLSSYRFAYQLVPWLCRLCIGDDTCPSLPTTQLPIPTNPCFKNYVRRILGPAGVTQLQIDVSGFNTFHRPNSLTVGICQQRGRE